MTAQKPRMNSRQRVTLALNHHEPDRVPFDLTFGYAAYKNLESYLDYHPVNEVLPSAPGLTVSPPLEILQELGVDLIHIGLGSAKDTKPFEYGIDCYTDEWGITYQKIEGGRSISYEPLDFPLRDARIKDLDDYPWLDPYDQSRVLGLEEKLHNLYKNTEFAIVGRFSTSIFEQAFMLRGYEQFLVDIALNPEFACALLDKTTEIAMGMLTAGLTAGGKYIQILRLAGDDMGHQTGTILSPRTFRSIIKPRFERVYKHAKSLLKSLNPDCKLMAHTDGDVYSIILDYIELGLDVLNPVQPGVTHMEHERLKREFGDRLCFHAGIDIQHVMPFGSSDDVRLHAVCTMRKLGTGGGYILSPTHYLQADVPAQNIIALCQAVNEEGWYPFTLRNS